MMIFLSFLVCMSLVPMTTFARDIPNPKITNADNLPFAVKGKPYEYTFTAKAEGTVTWEKVGAWPDWLNLDSSTGKIHGTPTSQKPFSADIKVLCRGSDGVTRRISANFTIYVYQLPEIKAEKGQVGSYVEISGTNLPDATQDSDYLGWDEIIFSDKFFPNGKPFLTIDGVPDGMKVWNAGQWISIDGTPTKVGTYSIKISLSTYVDSEKTKLIGTTEKTFILKVNPDVSMTQVAISFDKNGGSGTMPAVTKKAGETFVLPDCDFTAPTGKEFKAWEVNGVEKAVGDNITVNANTMVKAVWKDKPVIVNTSVMTIKPDGGKWADGTTTPKTYTVEVGKYFTLPEAPIKDGYTFLYWQGSKYNPGEQYLVTELDHTFTAVWQKNEVKPDNKGNTSSVNTKKVDKTSPKTGDNGMMYVYALELLMAASGMLILNARRNKNNLK